MTDAEAAAVLRRLYVRRTSITDREEWVSALWVDWGAENEAIAYAIRKLERFADRGRICGRHSVEDCKFCESDSPKSFPEMQVP